jgi:hypothetical protein
MAIATLQQLHAHKHKRRTRLMPNEKVPCFFTAAIKVLIEGALDRFDDSIRRQSTDVPAPPTQRGQPPPRPRPKKHRSPRRGPHRGREGGGKRALLSVFVEHNPNARRLCVFLGGAALRLDLRRHDERHRVEEFGSQWSVSSLSRVAADSRPIHSRCFFGWRHTCLYSSHRSAGSTE